MKHTRKILQSVDQVEELLAQIAKRVGGEGHLPPQHYAMLKMVDNIKTLAANQETVSHLIWAALKLINESIGTKTADEVQEIHEDAALMLEDALKILDREEWENHGKS